MKSPRVISRKYFYLIWLFFNLVLCAVRPFAFPNQPLSFHIYIALITFLISSFDWEMLLWLSPRLQKKFSPEKRLITLIIVQILISYIVSLIPFTVSNIVIIDAYDISIPFESAVIAQLLFFLSILLYNLLYFGSFYFFQWKENLLRSERLQREQAQVRYDVLRNHMNPHFLFNALTSLNSLIFENQQLASDFLQQLSKVYRYTLQNKEKETVSLQTEIEFVKNYIFLVRTRFPETVEISLNVPPQTMDKGIVPLTLQVLMENALKHNIFNSEEPMKICIEANEDFIFLENTLNRKQQVETSNKQGLENLRSLYQYISDIPVEVMEGEKTFTVKLPLIK